MLYVQAFISAFLFPVSFVVFVVLCSLCFWFHFLCPCISGWLPDFILRLHFLFVDYGLLLTRIVWCCLPALWSSLHIITVIYRLSQTNMLNQHATVVKSRCRLGSRGNLTVRLNYSSVIQVWLNKELADKLSSILFKVIRYSFVKWKYLTCGWSLLLCTWSWFVNCAQIAVRSDGAWLFLDSLIHQSSLSVLVCRFDRSASNFNYWKSIFHCSWAS